MAPVTGLLEARETAVQVRVEELREEAERVLAELAEAEAEAGGSGLRARRLAGRLGLELVPAKVEGVRSKVKRLVERGWLAEERPGVSHAEAGCRVTFRLRWRAKRRPMSMVIDHRTAASLLSGRVS
ncbi:hypothetical protein [Streptomyces lavendulae]|uniref:hypothetical protein n=1 Tax=Streptomyces lavendulae TaxID=1914 RepID=UPI0036B2B6B4